MKTLILMAFILAGPLAMGSVEEFKCIVGTSAFMLANLDENTAEPPKFYQLNLGYQLTTKDVISVELITWRYYGPLGVTVGESVPVSESKFPGYVSAVGVGLAYQRFLWKGLYAAFHGTWFNQKYFTPESVQIGSGEQLFLTLRLGYRLSFFADTFFLEPSLATTHWPINTGLPDSFQAVENRWSKYQVEPGLHVGFVF